MVKISPECVTGPEQGKSSGRITTFSLWTGMFRDGISSISVRKTKSMAYKGRGPIRTKTVIDNKIIEQVSSFNYLGKRI